MDRIVVVAEKKVSILPRPVIPSISQIDLGYIQMEMAILDRDDTNLLPGGDLSTLVDRYIPYVEVSHPNGIVRRFDDHGGMIREDTLAVADGIYGICDVPVDGDQIDAGMVAKSILRVVS